MNTRLRYTGTSYLRAFKRDFGPGSSISFDKIFNMYGAEAGFNKHTVDFVDWFVDNKLQPNPGFVIDLDEADYAQSVISTELPPPVVEATEATKAVGGEINSIVDLDLGPVPSVYVEGVTDNQEVVTTGQSRTGNIGVVSLESGKVEVTMTEESAKEHLVNKAKAKARFKQSLHERAADFGTGGPLITNSPETTVRSDNLSTYKDYQKEMGVMGRKQKENVITGDDLSRVNGPSPTNNRSFILNKARGAGESTSGLDTTAGPSLTDNSPTPNTYIHIPKTNASGEEGVNYGGQTSISPQKAEVIREATKSKQSAEKSQVVRSKGGQKNIMNQPQRAPIDSLIKGSSIEGIVQEPNGHVASKQIKGCQDAKTLKIAHKQLRELGKHKRAVEVERRLLELPPGF